MNRQLAGLVDKLYWRRTDGGLFHCFTSAFNHKPRFTSLCEVHTRERSGGGRMARPPAMMRCAQCDVAEIARRGVEESMPESPDWRDYHGVSQ